MINYLAQIRELDKKQIDKQSNIPIKMDNSKEKYFCTFPFPYMNGRLHLGHAYTITNVDIQATYQRLKGKNVLFPFGFHGSGMPIVSCANKLITELDNTSGIDVNEDYIKSLPLNSQIKILYEMKVPIDEIENFCIPEYWITYFSDKAICDLKAFGISADFNRSFYTTKLNPYFDSFIQWQFGHLIADNYLINGKRNIIFCEEDNQPCADHDRSIGEGIKPKEINCHRGTFDYLNLIATICDDLDENDDKLYLNPTETNYVSFYLDGTFYFANEFSYKNIKHQYCDTRCIGNIGKRLSNSNKKTYNYGTGIYCSKKYAKNFSYFEPESPVISRTGYKCIVANIDQTFINYADIELKNKIKEYVSQEIKVFPPEAYRQLAHTVEWLEEWPVSRNYGLGTCIPGTNDLIDSLSDSTIYMAYYTVIPKINQIPIELIDDKLWDFVFFGKEYNLSEEYKQIIQELREEFLYWYPVDLRISGKDLITNHLTMALFNHYAIWKDFKYLPKQYNINGYLMINGKKMSKSTGNFMTLFDAQQNYGSSITRFLLAKNNGIDDGDFRIIEINSIAVKLIEEREKCIEYYNFNYDGREDGLIDDIFRDNIKNTLYNVDQYYKIGNTNMIINSFYSLIDKKNKYLKRTQQASLTINSELIKYYVQTIVIMMKPIIPQWADSIIEETDIEDIWPDIHPLENKMNLYYDDMVNKVIEQIITNKKKYNKIVINIFKSFNTIELDVINNPDIIDTKTGKELGLYKTSQRYIRELIETYDQYVINNIAEHQMYEYYILTECLPILTGIDKQMFEFIEHENNEQLGAVKNNPGNPKIYFSVD